jgi:pimeloyl-ACP methyl ester carboxylesterase
MTANQQPQLVRLPDARRLAFADYGPPDRVPCIVLAGMPGSRLAPAWAFPEGLLAQRGVRLVGVDRPGYGRSDPNPGTSTLGVADDLGVLCEVVGLDRFAVLGISVGAPSPWPARSGSLTGWVRCCSAAPWALGSCPRPAPA